MRYVLGILFFILASTALRAQSYTYSYIDPCTRLLKTVTIPSGQANIQVTYFGTVGMFSQSDFQTGAFNSWMNNVSAINSNKPCDQVVTAATTSTNMIVTQNLISTLTNITSVSVMAADLSSSIASISGSGVSGALGNATNNSSEPGSSGSSSSSSSGNSSNSSGSGGSNGTSSSGTNGSGSGGGNTGGSGSNGGSGTGSGGSGSSGGSGTGSGGSGGGSGSSGGGSPETPQSGSTPPAESGTTGTSNSSGGNGGTTNSVSNAAEASSSDGGSNKSSSKTSARVGSLIGTGDLVAVRSAEDPSARDQFRFTASMTHANSKNTFAKGFLGNFTTQINNSNITFYGAWTKKNKTLIFANSSMLNFDRDFFNTTTALGSIRHKKVSGMLGLNATAGKLGKTTFVNVSAVGGGFFMFKPTKKITSTILLLGVYSPFTQFYEGNWWDSGILLVPFSSWDYSLTKKFKFNVSFSGVYQWSGNVLNYQVLTGGKILL
jgi:hypothetical protein